MQEPTSYAILLAGGKSQRMGKDKALLVYEGKTFLEHVLAVLLPLTDNILVVADRADKYVLPYGRIVVDKFPDTGPVGGILTGLMAAGPGAHWVVPCDMPTISPAVLRLLWKEAVPRFDAVVPEINGESEPLYAVYRDTAVPKLRRYLEGGQRSARGGLKTLNVRRISEDELYRADPDITSFLNINTPEELALLHQKRLTLKNPHDHTCPTDHVP